ncbi:MAG: NUDIX domain-containing protein [Nanoarchaeota archaeon]|nr:NUDIX domain-containing protein [Nanoarchaeota archaeon]MBU4116426.1 NUDIX domain-containing protein [Nanoarchaeota archaeon]
MKNKILSVFLYNNKLRFNEIEKLLKIRSNKLAYHLKKLEQKEILIKNKDYYQLSEIVESLIPYLSAKNSILPVILISIKKNKNIFLYKRQKRPFKDKLSLPGGRMLEKESIKKAVKRIMKEKLNINAEFIKINSISLEHVKKQDRTIHSFLLILTSAKTKDKLKYIDINKYKKEIINSDYNLLKNDLNKEIKIKTLITENT